MSRQVAVADVGGTHARFALAQIEGARVISLGQAVKLHTSDHASFQLAWEEFGRREKIDLPNELALSFAGPVGGEVLKLTNNPWVIRPSLMKERLGVERFTIVNDFGAVGYAVATLPDQDFRHVCGPERPLPSEGVTSIVGPGTGLGVAALLRKRDHYEVIETEGGTSISRRSTISRIRCWLISAVTSGGCRSSGWCRVAGFGTSTTRSRRSKAVTLNSTTRRNCGPLRSAMRTAWPTPRSTASASRSARSRETWRLRRAPTPSLSRVVWVYGWSTTFRVQASATDSSPKDVSNGEWMTCR